MWTLFEKFMTPAYILYVLVSIVIAFAFSVVFHVTAGAVETEILMGFFVSIILLCMLFFIIMQKVFIPKPNKTKPRGKRK